MPSNEVIEARSVGTRELHWIEKNIPCQWACPVLTDIPAYIAAVSERNYDLSYRINRHSNILPGVLGRICSRPCEDSCRHGESDLGTPVAICHIKRAGADNRREQLAFEPHPAPTGKKVAIVGSGPSGLAAAHDLALLGHSVTVYEAEDIAGGMLSLGIPDFRLPRAVLDEEIGYITSLGVEIALNTRIGRDVELEELLSTNDATIIATGNMLANELKIPGAELEGVLYGLPFLMEANRGNRVEVAEKVVVIGGGYTALDCARTSLRFGSKETGLHYRRTEKYLAGTSEEIHELKLERVRLHFLSQPVEIHGSGGKVSAVTFIRTTPFSGRKSRTSGFRAIEGSEFTVEMDTLIVAIGQHATFPFIGDDAGVDKDENGVPVLKGDSFSTTRDGLFLAGDCINGPGDVINAIAHGRTVAVSVDEYLTGKRRRKRTLLTVEARETGRIREYDFIERQMMPTVGKRSRINYSTEVEKGYTVKKTLTEAKRCYLCHFKYEIDVNRCIYCMACIEVAPRDCIKQVREFKVSDEGIIEGITEAENWDEVRAIYILGDRCIRCGNCERVCPTQCIGFTKVSLSESFEDR